MKIRRKPFWLAAGALVVIAMGLGLALLDPRVENPQTLLDVLVPALPSEGGRLVAQAVSTSVNDVRNNGPELVVPLAAEPPAPA